MAAIIELPRSTPEPSRGAYRPFAGDGSSPVSLLVDHRPPPSRPTSSIRPSRSRVGAALVAVALGVSVLFGFGRSVLAEGSAGAIPQESGMHHVVGPGETMWSIAADYLPDTGRAEAVDALVTLNAGR